MDGRMNGWIVPLYYFFLVSLTQTLTTKVTNSFFVIFVYKRSELDVEIISAEI